MIDPSELLNSISEPVDRAFLHRLDGLDRLIESIDKLTVAMTPVQKPPESVDIRNFPGFRPLHIEDGQVQEAEWNRTQYDEEWERLTNEKTVQARQNMPDYGPSVPEDEPQEQEATFAAVLDAYVSLCTGATHHATLMQLNPFYDYRDDRQLKEARDAVFAAAHREYAQPGYRELDSAYSQGYKDGQKARMVYADSAAQPGKGV